MEANGRCRVESRHSQPVPGFDFHTNPGLPGPAVRGGHAAPAKVGRVPEESGQIMGIVVGQMRYRPTGSKHRRVQRVIQGGGGLRLTRRASWSSLGEKDTADRGQPQHPRSAVAPKHLGATRSSGCDPVHTILDNRGPSGIGMEAGPYRLT